MQRDVLSPREQEKLDAGGSAVKIAIEWRMSCDWPPIFYSDNAPWKRPKNRHSSGRFKGEVDQFEKALKETDDAQVSLDEKSIWLENEKYEQEKEDMLEYIEERRFGRDDRRREFELDREERRTEKLIEREERKDERESRERMEE